MILTALTWRWRHVRGMLLNFSTLRRALGWSAYLTLIFAPIAGPLSRKPQRGLSIPGYRFPLYYRDASTDPWVVCQVIAHQEYACVGNEPDVRFILDCGANIGCASFFLLHRYPEARVLVVEPDSQNMAMCRMNLAPFGDRVHFVQAGVWSESAPMIVERGTYRDGGAWAFQVRPARADERPDFVAKTIADLIHQAQFPRVDLLKMDIEGSEKEVFRADTSWLRQVRTLVVELHGPECEAAVMNKLATFRYTVQKTEELTVFRDLNPL